MTKKAILAAIRPLRETIENSITWEGRFTVPEPVQIGDLTVVAWVAFNGHGAKVPYSIYYKALRGPAVVCDVKGAATFADVLKRKGGI